MDEEGASRALRATAAAVREVFVVVLVAFVAAVRLVSEEEPALEAGGL